MDSPSRNSVASQMNVAYVLGGMLIGVGLAMCIAVPITSPGWPILLFIGICVTLITVVFEEEIKRKDSQQ
jgi:hypothetical protein